MELFSLSGVREKALFLHLQNNVHTLYVLKPFFLCVIFSKVDLALISRNKSANLRFSSMAQVLPYFFSSNQD